MKYRAESDSMGQVLVPEESLWGAQTQRSLENFPIGRYTESMPNEIIQAFAYLKYSCALANHELDSVRMTDEKVRLISDACEKILSGELNNEFPLVVFQTGSGTQTNMNVNEVVSNFGNRQAGKKILHPNDDVNMSQSSNDTFPSALNISVVLALHNYLYEPLSNLISELRRLEDEYSDIIKCGRTHLQDAVPLSFGQEISGWRSSLEFDLERLKQAENGLYGLALGGTAVGTGLNAPKEFGDKAAALISEKTGFPFYSSGNKFSSLTSRGDVVYLHGALSAAAMDMMKIANDIRWMSSGPRNGLGEIMIPENEPGSSIMPGKVNPTQCEQVTMVAVQIAGNQTAVTFAASQGNFELNVFLPVIAYNVLQSIRLLGQSIDSFRKRCVSGIVPNREKMKDNLERSLMLVTALNPVIGYEKSAEIAKKAYREGTTLKQSCLSLGYLTEEDFDRYIRPERMI